MFNHDRLFKELLTTFFFEFIELFIPDLAKHIDRSSLVFLDKELFTDVTSGDVYQADLVVKAHLKDRESFFLIHTETQAQPQALFGKRLFRYFARLHDRHDLPVYPVVIFSFENPKRPQPCVYDVHLPTLHVLQFRYRVIQLNRLNWRLFLKSDNAVAAALMAKMAIAPEERPDVKLECLRMIATLRLDRSKSKLIAGFVDSYLRLTGTEQLSFERKLATLDVYNRESIMEIVTSWMEEGLKQGRLEGRIEACLDLTTRLLKRRLGFLSPELVSRLESLSLERLEQLGEALLDFQSSEDLCLWLNASNAPID